MDPVTGLRILKRKEVVRHNYYGKKSGLYYGICLDFEVFLKENRLQMCLIRTGDKLAPVRINETFFTRSQLMAPPPVKPKPQIGFK